MTDTSRVGIKRQVNGILLLDKPEGLTSNRALQRVKRLFAAQKAGHTGTLDPMATGLLPICFGAATRVSGLMLDATKRYSVTAKFGEATDTGDATGQFVAARPIDPPAAAVVESALGAMRGRSSQIPPMYSAVKHEGRRLYALAREGREVARRPRQIEILDIEVESYSWPSLAFRVLCSKGTYVRTLVSDLAAALGTVGHVTALRRLAVGPYRAEEMLTMDALEGIADAGQNSLDACLLGIDSALVHHPAVSVSDRDADALRHGRRVQVDAANAEREVRIYAGCGSFVGLGHLASSGELKPSRIFPV